MVAIRIAKLLALLVIAWPAPAANLVAQQTITVTFELHAPDLDSNTDLFITGSTQELGNWNPGRVGMKSLGNHRWTHQIQTVAGRPLEYKYTLGSWARERADADGNPLKNAVIEPVADSTVKDSAGHWTTDEKRKVTGQITGTVQYHRQLTFAGLLPRDVIVWLPPGYDQADDHYGVLYMHDGQNIIDPNTSAFGNDWQVDETLTRLIKEKICQPMIVVGIYCTTDRSREYAPGELGDRYISFVISKLKPLIDKHYRTKRHGQSTAVAGSSMGGICAFRMAWEHPDIFSAAICMSPALKYKKEDGSVTIDYVASVRSSETPVPIPFFYLDNGGVGLERILQAGIDEMIAALKGKGLREDKNFVWKHFPDDHHSETAWAARMPQALRLLPNERSASE